MAVPLEDEKFAKLVQRMDPQSRLMRAWELQGGVSAQVTALEIAQRDGRTRKLVVRRHGALDLARNPQIAGDEYRLMGLLRSAGVPVPAPYYLDQSGALFGTPYLVVEFVEGQPEFSPANLLDVTMQMAEQLARIHRVDGSRVDLPFVPKHVEKYTERLRQRPETMDESLGEGRMWETLAAAWPLPCRNAPVLLHGDYWPGNILWKDGRLVAVLDWEDAAVGDPLADVANSRLELLWAFGREAMLGFTQQYEALTSVNRTNLPYWELWAAWRTIPKFAEWATNAEAEQTMRDRLRWFITQAFGKLPAQGAR